MPELPEVHTITTDLKRYAQGADIVDVSFVNDYLPVSDSTYLIANTKGHRIDEVTRIAKNIVLKLSSKHFLTVHLAMTGKLLLRGETTPPDPHMRMVLNVKKNDKAFQLRYCDMRMFGKITIYHEADKHLLDAKYGPEPLDEKLTDIEFLTRLQSKKTNIKNVLLDQSIIAGLGNVYATDALFMAGINPQTNTKDITLRQAKKLLEACREILKEGIKHRGISMSDYVDLLGNKGSQQNFFRIYKKDICPTCKSAVEFIQLNTRGTYFCPKCQQL